jgi:hypothetical protein
MKLMPCSKPKVDVVSVLFSDTWEADFNARSVNTLL